MLERLSKVEREERVYNEMKKGTIEVFKVDYNTGNYLSNIKIGIYNDNKKLIKEGYTNNNGKFEINNLNIGNNLTIFLDAEILKIYYVFLVWTSLFWINSQSLIFPLKICCISSPVNTGDIL